MHPTPVTSSPQPVPQPPVSKQVSFSVKGGKEHDSRPFTYREFQQQIDRPPTLSPDPSKQSRRPSVTRIEHSGEQSLTRGNDGYSITRMTRRQNEPSTSQQPVEKSPPEEPQSRFVTILESPRRSTTLETAREDSLSDPTSAPPKEEEEQRDPEEPESAGGTVSPPEESRSRKLVAYAHEGKIFHRISFETYGALRVGEFTANSAYLFDDGKFAFRIVEKFLQPCPRGGFTRLQRMQPQDELGRIFVRLPDVPQMHVRDFVEKRICSLVTVRGEPYILEFRERTCQDQNPLTGLQPPPKPGLLRRLWNLLTGCGGQSRKG